MKKEVSIDKSPRAHVPLIVITAIDAVLYVTHFVAIFLSMFLLASEVGRHCTVETGVLREEGIWLFTLSLGQGLHIIISLCWNRCICRKEKELAEKYLSMQRNH